MMKPRHLERIYDPTDGEGLEGNIVCECGCRAFKIRCFGEFFHKNKLAIKEYENRYGQAVRAVCADCGRDYLLYDFALHGYDGLICGDGIAVPGEEIVNDESLQEDFHFTMADRADIWSWVVIELRGVSSGIVYRDFVNEELA